MKTNRRTLLAGLTGTALSIGGCLSLVGTSSDVGTVYYGEDQSTEPATDGRLPPATEDWPTSHHDRGRSAKSPVTGLPGENAQLKWTFEAPDGPVRPNEDESTTEPTDGTEYGGVIVVDGLAIFPTYGTIYAIDVRTGVPDWESDLPERGLTSPTASDGTIYLGLDGAVLALNAATGAREWMTGLDGGISQSRTPEWISGAPTIGEDHVFAGNYGGRLYALDKASGDILWTFDADIRDPSKEYSPDNRASFQYTSGYNEGVLYSGNANARVYAHDGASGEVLWTNVPERPPSTCHRIYSSPTVVGDTVYITSSCEVRAIDRETGEDLWTFADDPGSSRVSPIINDGTMYVASGDHYESLGMVAIDLETLSVEWRGPGRPIGDASYAGGTLYTGISSELFAIDAATGDVSWRMEMESVVGNAPPAITDGGVIVCDRAGVVYAIGEREGES